MVEIGRIPIRRFHCHRSHDDSAGYSSTQFSMSIIKHSVWKKVSQMPLQQYTDFQNGWTIAMTVSHDDSTIHIVKVLLLLLLLLVHRTHTWWQALSVTTWSVSEDHDDACSSDTFPGSQCEFCDHRNGPCQNEQKQTFVNIKYKKMHVTCINRKSINVI